MSEIAEVEQRDPWLVMIQTACTSKDVDVSKLSKLLDMQKEIMAIDAEQAYLSAFSGMQSELPSVRKEGKTQQSMYATFDDVMDTVRPILGKWGFSFTVKPNTKDGFLEIIATLAHKQGHKETSTMTLPFDTSGNKNNVQAIGSSLKYGMRYGIVSLLSISTHDGTDTDGESFQTVTDEESESLALACEVSGLDVARVYLYYSKHYKVPIGAWSDFPAGSFDAVNSFLAENAKNADSK